MLQCPTTWIPDAGSRAQHLAQRPKQVIGASSDVTLTLHALLESAVNGVTLRKCRVLSISGVDAGLRRRAHKQHTMVRAWWVSWRWGRQVWLPRTCSQVPRQVRIHSSLEIYHVWEIIGGGIGGTIIDCLRRLEISPKQCMGAHVVCAALEFRGIYREDPGARVLPLLSPSPPTNAKKRKPTYAGSRIFILILLLARRGS
jgi:hypothetical protein